MLAHEGSDYDEYVKTASRIDQALSEEADKADKKESKKETGRDTKKRPYNGNGGEYGKTSRKPLSTSRKPQTPEIKLEIGSDECHECGLCHHCKEKGHIRRECPLLSKKPVKKTHEENSSSTHPPQINAICAQIPTVNRVGRGYAVKAARTYKEALLGIHPTKKLEIPS